MAFHLFEIFVVSMEVLNFHFGFQNRKNGELKKNYIAKAMFVS